jgi:dCMP deaminase
MSAEAKREAFFTVAKTIGELGTCDRKKVGAVIVRDGRCISWGYNGAPPGAPHCHDNNHGWEEGDAPSKGCRNATHAEANAIAFAARQGISTDGAMLYVTLSPCESCARLIIAAGIVAVHSLEMYRDYTGVEILMQAGVLLGS